MIAPTRAASWFSTSLLARGALMVFLGVAGIGWPDGVLVYAMLVAAALLAVLGSFEMVLALRTRRSTKGWMIPMYNGAACVGFAILTLVFPGLSLNVTLMLVAIWLLLYAALTAGLALALWPMTRTRNTLLAWTALDVALAIAAVTVPDATIFTLLYVGAGYSVAFGALQVASGLWIKRVAVPTVAPTIQSTWPVARHR